MKVFISYSWDTEEHKKWVLDLANKLVKEGVNVGEAVEVEVGVDVDVCEGVIEGVGVEVDVCEGVIEGVGVEVGV